MQLLVYPEIPYKKVSNLHSFSLANNIHHCELFLPSNHWGKYYDYFVFFLLRLFFAQFFLVNRCNMTWLDVITRNSLNHLTHRSILYIKHLRNKCILTRSVKETTIFKAPFINISFTQFNTTRIAFEYSRISVFVCRGKTMWSKCNDSIYITCTGFMASASQQRLEWIKLTENATELGEQPAQPLTILQKFKIKQNSSEDGDQYIVQTLFNTSTKRQGKWKEQQYMHWEAIIKGIVQPVISIETCSGFNDIILLFQTSIRSVASQTRTVNIVCAYQWPEYMWGIIVAWIQPLP